MPPTLSIVIVSCNRRDALLRTLAEMHAAGQALAGVVDLARIVVSDNASADGSVEAVRHSFPDVHILAHANNTGVAAFNRGVEACASEFVLVLDDDAWTDAKTIHAALELLEREPAIAGVALLPTHPATGAAEWPFARAAHRAFPFMGCGNLVRASAWREVGGYEETFFLYRNDADLALKLLAAGHGVAFDPAWRVLHDTAWGAGQRKSERWLELATRNWLWMCRRHGRGVGGLVMSALGPAHAVRCAGLSPRRLACVLRGVRAGVFRPPPPLPAACVRRGTGLREMLRLRVGL